MCGFLHLIYYQKAIKMDDRHRQDIQRSIENSIYKLRVHETVGMQKTSISENVMLRNKKYFNLHLHASKKYIQLS